MIDIYRSMYGNFPKHVSIHMSVKMSIPSWKEMYGWKKSCCVATWKLEWYLYSCCSFLVKELFMIPYT